MRTIGNILWFLLFGFVSGLSYITLGVVCCITIIGIPFGKACFQYAKLMFWPFGKVIVKESFIKGKENISSLRRFFGILANTLWFPVGSVLFMLNVILVVFCFITIILIPVGMVLKKSGRFLLQPVGAKVINVSEYESIVRQREMTSQLEHLQQQQNEFQQQAMVGNPIEQERMVNNINESEIVQETRVISELIQIKENTENVSVSEDVVEQQLIQQNIETIKKEDYLKNIKETTVASLETIGATVVTTSVKVGNKTKEYSNNVITYLQNTHAQKSEMINNKDIELLWTNIFDYIEKKFYKNNYMAYFMTFLEYIIAVFAVIYFVTGIIGNVHTFGVLSIFIGIRTGSPIFFAFGVLCVIKKNYKLAIIIFSILVGILLINKICFFSFANMFTDIVVLCIYICSIIFVLKLFKSQTGVSKE